MTYGIIRSDRLKFGIIDISIRPAHLFQTPVGAIKAKTVVLTKKKTLNIWVFFRI